MWHFIARQISNKQKSQDIVCKPQQLLTYANSLIHTLLKRVYQNFDRIRSSNKDKSFTVTQFYNRNNQVKIFYTFQKKSNKYCTFLQLNILRSQVNSSDLQLSIQIH